MTDWQIIESDRFPDAPPEAPPPVRRQRAWLLLAAGLLLFLGGASLLALREWRLENRAALRADLSEAIFTEESLRQLGRPEEALISADAPPRWRLAYRLTFADANDDNVQAVSGLLELADIQFFDGSCAVVALAEPPGNGPSLLDPIRAYCLGREGWHRAPIPEIAWGEFQQPLRLTNGSELRFYARDQLFAEDLAQDLNQFFSQIDELDLPTDSARATSLPKLNIIVEPHDLEGPLIFADPDQIIVNSPELAVAESVATSERAALLRQTPVRSGEAVVRQALVQALLDRIIPHQLPADLSLRNMERLQAAIRAVTAASTLFIPITAHLAQIEPELETRQFSVTLPDQTESLLVELPPAAIVETPEGLPLPLTCLRPGAELALTGEWLEFSRRLQASRITVQQMPLLTIEPAPVDILAYLIITKPGSRSTSGPLSDKLPYQRPGFQAQGSPPSQLFAALRANQTLQPLLLFDTSVQLFPLPTLAGQSIHFLLQFDLPDCDRSWFAHYEPARGITGHWFGPPSTMQWTWQPDRQAPLFFKRPRGTQPGYRVYGANHTLILNTAGRSERPFSVMGWHVETRQLVAAVFSAGGISLGLLNVETGDISGLIRPDFRALEARNLSPDGNWLAYPAGRQHLFGPSNRVDLLNLAEQSTLTLVQIEPDQRLGRPFWSDYLTHDDQVAFLAGPVAAPLDSSDTFRPIRLLVARPDRPGSYTLVAEAAEEEQFDWPVFCRAGSLLYRVAQNGLYQLQHQRPGAPAKLLFSLDQPFWPVGCP